MSTNHRITVVQTNNSWHVVPGILRAVPGDAVTFATPGPDLRISFLHDGFEVGLIKVSQKNSYDLEIPRLEPNIYPYVVIVDSECGLVSAEGSTLPVFLIEY